MQVLTEMFSVGDHVKIIEVFTNFPQLLHQIGIITVAAPANKITDVAMYDVQIGNDTYVYFHDELELVPQIGAH